MAKTISASVGRGGVNRQADTVTIQELLNRVPVSSGGPTPLLDVDGLCGPITTSAIQNFQLKQWGWALADGRVDPAGPTLARLNDFDTPGITPVPPVPLPVELPKGTNFGIFRMGSEKVVTSEDRYLFFYVLDVANNLAAVYWLKPALRPKTTLTPPPGHTFAGSGGVFHVNVPRSITELGCPAAWMSTESVGSHQVTSKLVLFYPDSPAQVPMNHHLIGPGGMVSSPPGSTGGGSTSIAGDLIFIERR